uniref:Uncharacterized protein n=1 Tax=Kalanchoe fedtschenkoi TaxID=63787 RepID=A0A7N0RF02_KALFE
MSRPMLLVFLLIVLIITLQFEWKQPLVTDQDATPSVSKKQLRIPERQEEAVKQKTEVKKHPGSQKHSPKSSRTAKAPPSR